MANLTTYNVYVDGVRVASASGANDDAYQEALHYALMYSTEGVVEIKKQKKVKRESNNRIP